MVSKIFATSVTKYDELQDFNKKESFHKTHSSCATKNKLCHKPLLENSWIYHGSGS